MRVLEPAAGIEQDDGFVVADPALVPQVLERGQDAMLAIRNFGEKSLTELKDKLKEKGYPVEDTEVTA